MCLRELASVRPMIIDAGHDGVTAGGLTADDRVSADRTLSFGPATWPHLLVRAMLVEQLYRATTIIAGHPYHRDG